ncbi:MAG: 30S ribosome-binding factor RbfA [Clostridia bacterium]|nr:30S ribosome-binding factor RbfA [Clostridia bacterium]
MANYRRGRINDEMQKEVAQILREVKDPRVSGAFVSVIAAEVTPDLKYAKIYYSYLNQSDPKEVERGLKAASGYIRREISTRMNLRITPELTFIRDNSIAHGAHIAQLLNGITFSEDFGEETSEEKSDD